MGYITLERMLHTFASRARSDVRSAKDINPVEAPAFDFGSLNRSLIPKNELRVTFLVLCTLFFVASLDRVSVVCLHR